VTPQAEQPTPWFDTGALPSKRQIHLIRGQNIDVDLVARHAVPAGCPSRFRMILNGDRALHNEDQLPTTHWHLARTLVGLLPKWSYRESQKCMS